MSDQETEPMNDGNLRMVDSDTAFNQSCMEILRIIAEEQKTGVVNDYIAGICDDMEKLVAEGRTHALRLMQIMGSGRPTFVLYSKAGSGAVIPVLLEDMPPTMEAKLKIAAPLHIVVNLAPVDAYFVFSEVWYAVNEKGVEDDRMPSERPDRQEALMVCAHQPGKTAHRTFRIVRDDDGAVLDLVSMDGFIASDVAEVKVQNPLLENFYDKAEKLGEVLTAFMKEKTVH